MNEYVKVTDLQGNDFDIDKSLFNPAYCRTYAHGSRQMILMNDNGIYLNISCDQINKNLSAYIFDPCMQVEVDIEYKELCQLLF